MSGEDCISRARAIERLKLNLPISQGADGSRDRQRYMQALADIQAIRELPSVTPQEPQTFKWCTDCKEYDQDEHCCHRWSKVIRDTVEEMKQEYIEREVLDKIKAEIEARLKADTTEKFKEFRDKLSKWMFHNSESVCGCSMIDIDYLEGHMDELLYELGIYGEVLENED